ncbi:MAG: MarR family winged helix-turn-helix transcriptional regulator [Trebonia sp.]
MTPRISAPGTNVSPPRSADSDEPMLMYLIKQVELAVRSCLDDLLRPDELTALQYTALTALEHHPRISSAQLARNSFVTAQSMADMINTLEQRGLIERHRDKADRRRLSIALSPAGQELLDRYRSRVAALESQMLHGVTRPQAAALRRGLTACHANLIVGQLRLSDAARGGADLFRSAPLGSMSARSGAVGCACVPCALQGIKHLMSCPGCLHLLRSSASAC